MNSLKQRKEQFVSDLSGGTTQEIYAVTAVALTAYFVWGVFKTRTSLFHSRSATALMMDFGLNWVSLLLGITTYSKAPGHLNALLLLPAVGMLLLLPAVGPLARGPTETNPHLPRKAFLTTYRLSMIVITNIAILAVDFKVFPRRFAKVETWGTSLMDLGVGSFVFSMGLATSRNLIKQAAGTLPPGLRATPRAFARALRSAMPLLVLGLGRLVSVKNLAYQEHVSEYGVHWNFFFTLGFLPPAVALLEPVIAYVPRVVVALLVGYAYELCLANHPTLLKFLMTGERVDVFSANKEGIFSFIGYLAIFLSGQSVGWFVLPGYKTPFNLYRPASGPEIERSLQAKKPAGNRLWERLTTVSPITGLVFFAVAFHGLSLYLQTNYQYGVSRRLANLPYVVWVNAYNVTFLLGFVLMDKIVFGPEAAVVYLERVPEGLEAINRNGLAVFLLANLTTGMVNMGINTLDCGPWVSMALLIGYCFGLSVTAVVLLRRGIFIKV